MQKKSFTQAPVAAKKKTTRREWFLAEMERVVPWSKLLTALGPPYYPDSRGVPCASCSGTRLRKRLSGPWWRRILCG